MLKQPPQQSGRKPAGGPGGSPAAAGGGTNPPTANSSSNSSAAAANGTVSPVTGLANSRPTAGRGRSMGKGPSQSPVFEGVYSNSRMLHFLTAVVGSTCDVKVRNGAVYEGIFKTLSSKFELAVDAVHRKNPDQIVGPKREDIIDTMIFKHSDVVMVHFKNIDLNYATKDRFTDSAIANNSKVNGEHKEKVLQRWEGGDSNSDDYDLESDMSNGWDPNDMFKYNEENYGVKTTYDKSLSLYTIPLEKDNSDEFRQREARATQLAREIESNPQYRMRIAMENDDGKTEEEKHSAIVRAVSDRDSPNIVSRETKHNPLPQRAREGSRGGMRSSSSRGGRPGSGSLPPRGSSHHPETSSSPVQEQRVINGGPSRMSPKAQRPMRGPKPLSTPSSQRPVEVSTTPPAAAVTRIYPPRSPKSGSTPPSVSSQDSPSGSAAPSAPTSPPEPRPCVETAATTASPNPPSPKTVAPTPLFTVDVKEILAAGGKDPMRPPDTSGPPEGIRPAAKEPPSEHKRNQIEELKKFGEDFRLPPGSTPDLGVDTLPSRPKEGGESKPKEKLPSSNTADAETTTEPGAVAVQKPSTEAGESKEDKAVAVVAAVVTTLERTDRQAQAASPLSKGEAEDKEAPMSDQVKKSTLNPNAKEFNPLKPMLPVNKPTSTPTPPRPQTLPSPSISMPVQGGMYNQYISYVHMNPAVQGPQMYQYAVSTSVPLQQGKYRGAKGSVPPQRSDQHHPTSAPPIMQAAAAAGPPLVAAPYSPSFIQYNAQQFTSQPAMMQAMTHYPSQAVYAPMIQSNPRMMSGAHPQAIVSSSTPQYPPPEQANPQAMYPPVPQPYPHHTGPLHPHPPQPATTPTGTQQQAQQAAPSPVQHQGAQPTHLGSGQPQQSLYHTTTLTPTPPSITPGPNTQSPQSSFQQPVYAIHAHQQLQHGYTNMAHLTQVRAHVQSGMAAGPGHHGASHHAQVMLLHAPQTHGGPPQSAVPHSGVPPISASTPTHYTYIGHHQVQPHPSQQLSFHPQGN
ncbi:ataxin-2-like protein isoform X3 [Latimeria chalumnae]|uniref:ataxin-2-like protein isoform X3 n=1 Tax=Latimeria chalumnae TaxID=7897 RepID=UPI0003C19F88|nr:PREDICTED: ataxin-2-like protein isoform X3 [Latimeria chalumnae]|eukprot:XP_006005920.1 PREDICTED: ataxin-2-like protein isoform X3 [Latimeria chalumnae]